MLRLKEYIDEKLKLTNGSKLVKSDMDQIIDFIYKTYYTKNNFNIETVSSKEFKITFSNKWSRDDVELLKKLIIKDVGRYTGDDKYITDTFIFERPLVLAVRIK